MTEREGVFGRVHMLAGRCLGGESSDEDRKELDALVQSSDAARRLYLEYTSDTATLRMMASASAGAASRPASSVFGRRRALVASVGTLTAAVLVVIVGSLLVRPRESSEPVVAVGGATLVRASAVQWAEGAREWQPLSRLGPGDCVMIDKGEVQLIFDTGVEVIASGMARLTVDGRDRMTSRGGRIHATVGEQGKGFVVVTPMAEVTDHGTEFVLDVGDGGVTDLAVYSGRVDLALNQTSAADRESGPYRLQQGEGIRVDGSGLQRRMMSIVDPISPEGEGGTSGESIAGPYITGVSDNSPPTAIGKFYRVVPAGLREDAKAYVDREHEWNSVDVSGLPPCLRGIDYVMTFNDDKHLEGHEVSIDVSRPAMVYVFVSRLVAVPQWLRDGFQETGLSIGLDEGMSRRKGHRKTAHGPGASVDTIFAIWSRPIHAPCRVVLGSLSDRRTRDGFNMYGIAAGPLPPHDADAVPGAPARETP